MQYINKNTGQVAAQLSYTGNGVWDLFPQNQNRIRVLHDQFIVTMIDIDGGPTIEVGKEMPGYNRVVSEIVWCQIDPNHSEEQFEIWCDDEMTIE